MPKAIQRKHFEQLVNTAFRVHKIVGLLGPRQCGKTTLAKHFKKIDAARYFDLENPRDLSALQDPLLALEDLKDLIVIDEIQRLPELFPILRVLADQPIKRNFLILGSASRELIQQSSETLAGRIAYVELTPFNFNEVDHMEKLWLRGGFPRSYLAKANKDSLAWRESYITTFLEKDIPNLGIRIPPRTLRRFWMMLTHYHGNIFNASEIGTAIGAAHTTVRHYLDILTGTFMIRELSPWFENISKRQIKSPKIYFRDTGILHALLGIETKAELMRHPKLGASWEGFALEEIIRHHNASREECYFWGVHNAAELDLLIHKGGKRIGFEFKYSDTAKLTNSMKTSLETLNLDELNVITPKGKTYKLAKKINVYGLRDYLDS